MLIEVKNLCIKFQEKVIFNDYSLTMPSNDIYCIVGKSGCGKTTLMRCIAGLHKPDSGTVEIDNQIVKKPSSKVCIMPQDHTNMEWLNVLDNVLFSLKVTHQKITKEAKDKAMKILKIMELDDNATKFPYELSGGMNQRLAMARIIMQEPEVLLMDEPLSALDKETRENLQNFLLQFNSDFNTIIIVTHDMEEAKKLARGNIISIGNNS